MGASHRLQLLLIFRTPKKRKEKKIQKRGGGGIAYLSKYQVRDRQKNIKLITSLSRDF